MDPDLADNKFSVEMLQVALNETESDDEIIDEESDFEEVEPFFSESDNSDSEDDDLFEAPYDRNDPSKARNNADHFVSKNGKIKWFKTPVQSNGAAITSADLDCSETGVQTLARNASTPQEIFSLFFDDRVLDLIVSHSNSRVKRISKRYDRYRDSKEMSKEELSAFIGLLLYSGVMKSSHGQLKDLWATDSTGIDMFRLTMSFSRFQFIMSCLRFDEYETRRINMKINRTTPIKDLMSLIQGNFKKMYTPGRSVSIYEYVIPFRGKCPFKQHSSEKPKKYGIKLNCVVDSKNFYFLSCEINTDKRKHCDEARVSIVLRLVDDLRESYRDVITTTPYTCVPLALALKQRGLFQVGTLSKRDKDIPKFFRKVRKPVKSSVYGFTDELSMISYVPQKRHIQIYLSNRTQDRIVDKNCTKPECIYTVENVEREAEDLYQNLLHFGVGRKTRRWPLLMFFHLLNMATLNSQIIFNDNKGSHSTNKSEFVKQLALGLIREHMEKRSQSGYLPKELRKRIRLNVDVPPETSAPLIHHPIEGPSKGRCHICTRNKDKKSSTRCCMCQHFICKEHAVVTCNSCFQNLQV